VLGFAVQSNHIEGLGDSKPGCEGRGQYLEMAGATFDAKCPEKPSFRGIKAAFPRPTLPLGASSHG
jgi:hypothetical protein